MQHDWEIWLDCHISPIIAKWLIDESNIVVQSAYKLKLYGLSDMEIYLRAKAKGNVIIISKDSDLEEIVTINGTPPKLINLKTGNCDNRVLFTLLQKKIPQAIRFFTDFKQKDIIEITQ